MTKLLTDSGMTRLSASTDESASHSASFSMSPTSSAMMTSVFGTGAIALAPCQACTDMPCYVTAAAYMAPELCHSTRTTQTEYGCYVDQYSFGWVTVAKQYTIDCVTLVFVKDHDV